MPSIYGQEHSLYNAINNASGGNPSTMAHINALALQQEKILTEQFAVREAATIKAQEEKASALVQKERERYEQLQDVSNKERSTMFKKLMEDKKIPQGTHAATVHNPGAHAYPDQLAACNETEHEAAIAKGLGMMLSGSTFQIKYGLQLLKKQFDEEHVEMLEDMHAAFQSGDINAEIVKDTIAVLLTSCIYHILLDMCAVVSSHSTKQQSDIDYITHERIHVSTHVGHC
jgi:cell pole-organizing protein PopZ